MGVKVAESGQRTADSEKSQEDHVTDKDIVLAVAWR